ncbi:MAG: hypothetical protein NC548_22930 [Lachnospiraceae bacterium]|nr:hypothetical protein [Lachnospiraceae bacterium]
MFEVQWTGSYPAMCHGEWKIFKNGVDVSDVIPEELRDDHMNTAGEYQRWYFGKDYQEEWDTYESGLEEEEWIEKNPWTLKICDNYIEASELFHKIQKQDWRKGCCGGCI